MKFCFAGGARGRLSKSAADAASENTASARGRAASAAAGARAESVSALAAPSKEADKSVVLVLDDSGDELRDLLDSTSTRRSAPP